QLAIEFVAEMVRGELHARPHPLPFGIGELADPAVLQHGERDQRTAERKEGEQRDDRAAAGPHGGESSIQKCAELSANAGFTFLTNALRSLDYSPPSRRRSRRSISRSARRASRSSNRSAPRTRSCTR